jgi:hypothetical protein
VRANLSRADDGDGVHSCGIVTIIIGSHAARRGTS